MGVQPGFLQLFYRNTIARHFPPTFSGRLAEMGIFAKKSDAGAAPCPESRGGPLQLLIIRGRIPPVVS